MDTPVVLVVVYAVYYLLWHSYELRRRLTSLSQVALIANSFVALLPSVALDLIYARVFGSGAELYSDLVLRVLVWISAVLLFLFRLGVIYSGLVTTQRDATADHQDERVATGIRQVRRQIWVTVAGGLAVLALLVALGVWCIGTGGSLDYDPAAFADPRTATFHALTGIGGVLILWTTGWMLRSASRAWRDTHASPQLRLLIGVWVASVGFTAMGLAAVIRAVPPALALVGLTIAAPPSTAFATLQLLSGPFVALGLTFPLIVARIVGWRSQRTRRRIRPLWKSLTDLYRNRLVVDTAGMTSQEASAWMLQRQRNETIDGLRNLTAQVPEAATGPTETAVARRLRAAIATYDAAHPARTVSALLDGTARPTRLTRLRDTRTATVLRQTFTGTDADAALEDKVLSQLSDALRRTKSEPEPAAAPA